FPAWDPTALRLVAPMRGIANLRSQPPHRGTSKNFSHKHFTHTDARQRITKLLEQVVKQLL
ncbi:MAG: hypothetical protein C6W58_03240, partial [Bacillaceae bacterium]